MQRHANRVRAVLFDFDGTLTLPGHLDFPAIRQAIGCPPGESLLQYIDSLGDPEARRRAADILDRFEAEAADRSCEDPDAGEVVRSCAKRGLPLGIITRNSRRSLERSFAQFSEIKIADFSCVITRDDPVSVKPSPDGVLLACDRLGVSPEETVVVGDYLYDIEAGERAGAITVFYDSAPERTFERPSCDHRIDRLGELPFVLSLYEPLPAGKVPNELLDYFLSSRETESAVRVEGAGEASGTAGAATGADSGDAGELLVGPGVGQDVAAVAVAAADRVLLFKSDPITLAGEDFGHYLLTVNANDIATAGGAPHWFLATLLAPPGTSGAEIGRMFADVRSACKRFGVVLCGGHSELTDAVTRPVLSGTMIGTVERERLVRKEGMSTGDQILLTKGVAVEGTVILATEHQDLLRREGVEEEVIRSASQLSDRMSIVGEARMAVSEGAVTAMHDVTEGGVATALRELSIAGGHRLAVDLDAIPIFPETRRCCDALGLDPLGLIGSGSLLMCVRPGAEDALRARFAAIGSRVAFIGTVLDPGEGVVAHRGGTPCILPSFDADELTRLH